MMTGGDRLVSRGSPSTTVPVRLSQPSPEVHVLVFDGTAPWAPVRSSCPDWNVGPVSPEQFDTVAGDLTHLLGDVVGGADAIRRSDEVEGLLDGGYAVVIVRWEGSSGPSHRHPTDRNRGT